MCILALFVQDLAVIPLPQTSVLSSDSETEEESSSSSDEDSSNDTDSCSQGESGSGQNPHRIAESPHRSHNQQTHIVEL